MPESAYVPGVFFKYSGQFRTVFFKNSGQFHTVSQHHSVGWGGLVPLSLGVYRGTGPLKLATQMGV